jgi:LysW-gamma-L-alpha-aminoadipyl-6-phosphate/LysW-L-glutamyl-5-phosphate reductase
VSRLDVAVLGGSGYIGGELVRLLLGHPRVRLTQVIARRAAGQPVGSVHPNLRGLTPLRFAGLEDLRPADVMFSALPHGALLELLPAIEHVAPCWIDLAADHRLRDEAARRRVYGWGERPGAWVAGIPERHAAELPGATRVSIPGCMATASILALGPLVDAGLVAGPIVLDVLTGSSGAGAEPDASSHHAERAGAMRAYAPSGHRHQPEIGEELGLAADAVRMTVTAVEPVRGILAKAHVEVCRPLQEADLRKLFARAYGAAPFVRIVAQRRGIHRLPDPRWLTGSNFCDVGFALDPSGRRLLLLAAIDNLMKGGAGAAVHALNVVQGWDEREGLGFPGLHPV